MASLYNEVITQPANVIELSPIRFPSMPMTKFALVLLACSLLLSACGAQNIDSAVSTRLAQTQQVADLETAAAAAQFTSTPVDTATPSKTPTGANTSTPTATATRTLPPAPTATRTNNPDYNYSGSWNIRWDSSTYSMSVTISGNNFSGTMSTGVLTYTYSGTLSNAGQVVNGSWSHQNGGTGDFQIQIKSGNVNQFIGSKTDDGSGMPASEFCGWRSGTSMPSPCKWP